MATWMQNCLSCRNDPATRSAQNGGNKRLSEATDPNLERATKLRSSGGVICDPQFSLVSRVQ
jgi:hypothetical protein